MNIILSIHPEHAANIYSGKKSLELRRVVPKKLNAGDTVYIYETAPVRMITGYFVFGGFVVCDYNNVLSWAESACVNNVDIMSYFLGKKLCTAMKIFKSARYKYPIVPSWKSPPQNFIYGDSFNV